MSEAGLSPKESGHTMQWTQAYQLLYWHDHLAHWPVSKDLEGSTCLEQLVSAVDLAVPLKNNLLMTHNKHHSLDVDLLEVKDLSHRLLTYRSHYDGILRLLNRNMRTHYSCEGHKGVIEQCWRDKSPLSTNTIQGQFFN
jgi:hypothetical protein